MSMRMMALFINSFVRFLCNIRKILATRLTCFLVLLIVRYNIGQSVLPTPSNKRLCVLAQGKKFKLSPSLNFPSCCYDMIVETKIVTQACGESSSYLKI